MLYGIILVRILKNKLHEALEKKRIRRNEQLISCKVSSSVSCVGRHADGIACSARERQEKP